MTKNNKLTDKDVASVDRVKKFLKALQTNLPAQQMARSFDMPQNDEEAVEGYVRLARKMGLDISREEMTAGLHSLTQAVRENTASAEQKIVQIQEEDLDEVTGGTSGAWYPSYCQELFEEDKWCWYADACSGPINNYTDVIEELSD